MGEVRDSLAERTLADREKHNSRLFVDLGENIHIHFREFRFVFSLPEYFEFTQIIAKSTEDVRNYLRQNPEYREQEYPTTVFIAGGPARQFQFLKNSPEPNRSVYFNNDLKVELQTETVTDEIHLHYRDFRLCLNRENFATFAKTMGEALGRLGAIEASGTYSRAPHPDRAIENWQESPRVAGFETQTMGVVSVPLDQIRSNWHKDLVADWKPDRATIDTLKRELANGTPLSPVVLTSRIDGHHLIVDGHHRVRAALEAGRTVVSAVISDLSWKQSEPIRQAEVLFKEFDLSTNNQYNLAGFFQSFLAHSLNTHYRNHYRDLRSSGGAWLLPIKRFAKRVLPPRVKAWLVRMRRDWSW
jgi:hypothetical protein